MCMHSTPPRHGSQHATNTYRADILDVGVPDKKHVITVISLQHPHYLCTQGGVFPGIPHQTIQHHSDHVAFVYIASFWLANQNSVSDQPISI